MTQKDSDLNRRVLLRASTVGAAAAGMAVLSAPSAASAEAGPSRGYDVTTWRHSTNPAITCYTDIGALINDIIADIKTRQPSQSSKPGAVIYIPPGDYPLKTRVTVDVSYLTIRGDGHGFASSSIRYNAGDTSAWHEIWPGGSRIRVENTDGESEAFLVSRSGDPRLSSVVFDNFCLDGISFTPNQNSYANGKVGIRVDTANDAFRIERMGFVYLERALIVRDADALSVRGNFIAECGSCVELIGSGQASKVTDNHIGAGYIGYSIFAEQHQGLLIAGNNIFPRGKSLVHLRNTNRSSITGNRLHGFYPGMLDSDGINKENLISGNHFRREPEPWGPMQPYDNGKDDLYGLIHLRGDGNMVTGNLFAYDVAPAKIKPSGAEPTMILVATGSGNHVSNNSVVSNVAVNAVVLDESTHGTKVIDSATASQFVTYAADYTFRATP
ncbi:inulin fructotransferase (DFA-I-forming) [Thermocatellispora tengchongensis]|uniref:Inulin fructotransferase (DFA-I-forming) n=1 Tax=Thermocatellispora tengchongensis TaxID=1073253 RepID=A0A840PHE3_9ACTN|nr:NosD domain-containing protein [Thermocatellispora tengchongensis]MBB5137343.1 inulin fructotransferase (DFA-I-forming) [Thermocatellispora tengchongensis]